MKAPVVDEVIKLVVCSVAQLKSCAVPIHILIAWLIICGALFFVIAGAM